MKSTLLFPSSVEEGSKLEDIAIFAARRCRTTKSHGELLEEVAGYSLERKGNFLKRVVNEDWALDILEFPILIYDLEDIPLWLIVEFLRHRYLARDFSFEQLSQRAIDSSRLRVDVPEPFTALVDKYVKEILEIAKDESIPIEDIRATYPQGILVNLAISSNLRAFQHLFYMRCSPKLGGKGGAHPKFQTLADGMFEQAKEVYPMCLSEILPS